MKKMIALLLCLVFCLAMISAHADKAGETAESLIKQAMELYEAEDYQGTAELIKNYE